MAHLSIRSFSWPQRLAGAWLGLVVLAAALAGTFPYAPNFLDLAHAAQPPCGPGHHWLGTDPQGRDVASLLAAGARTAAALTVPAAALAGLVGGLVGSIAGFWGSRARLAVPYWLLLLGAIWWGLRLPVPVVGLATAGAGAVWLAASVRSQQRLPTWPLPLDALVLGAATALDTIPRLVLVVALAAGAGVSGPALLALLVFTAWPHPARLVRSQMRRVRGLPFVEAARAAGLPEGRIWWRHALPHALPPLRTALPLSLAGLLGLESTLSFLGVGLPPDVPSWGRLLAVAREAPDAWWVAIPAILCLVLSILSLYVMAGKTYFSSFAFPR